MKQLFLLMLSCSVKLLLKIKKPIIIGVTGSAGKSSFVYGLHATLSPHYPTKTTFKGNSQTGIPLEILGLRSLAKSFSLINWIYIGLLIPFAFIYQLFSWKAKYLIVEMGIDGPKKPNNMEFLLDFISPRIGVILNVSTVHAQQFAHELNLNEHPDTILPIIAEEKGKLVTRLSETDAYAILTDDPHIQSLKSKIQVNTITVGRSSVSDFKLISYKNDNLTSSFSFQFQNTTYEVRIDHYFISEAHTSTLMAVIATAYLLGVPIQESITALETTKLFPPGRASILEGIHHSRILDSSYNSSPIALSALLKSISQFIDKKKVILVLGDMRELGPLSRSEHEALVPLIAKTSTRIILVGEQMGSYVYPLLKEPLNVHHFINTFSAAEYVKDIIASNDIVVVKGSQNTIFLEILVKMILANPTTSSGLLCRQSREWDSIRKKHFSPTVE